MADLARASSQPSLNVLTGFCRNSPECRVLEQRYPGIRFNRVEVSIFARHFFKHAPDEDYVDVWFNISGT